MTERSPLLALSPGPLIERIGAGYKMAWRDGIALHIDRLRESRGELHGELTVRQGGDHILRGSFNASNISARQTAERYLRDRTGDQQWGAVLERFCVELLDAYRDGEEVIYVGGQPVEDRRPMLLSPVLAHDEPSILFGLGGAGKTTLAAAWSVSMQTGREVIPGFSPSRPVNVLVLDYEATPAEWNARINEIALGAGLEPPRIAYRPGLAPVASDVPYLAEFRAEHGIGLILVDSVGMAAGQTRDGGDAAETTHRLFDAVRVIGGTWVLIDHIAHSETGADDPRPYGSVMKVNRARSVFELRAEREPRSGVREMLLRQTKTNNAAKLPPIGLQVIHEDGTIRFDPVAVTAPELERLSGSVPERIARLLGTRGALTRAEIAAALGVGRVRVQQALDPRRGGGRFVKLPDGRVGLAR